MPYFKHSIILTISSLAICLVLWVLLVSAGTFDRWLREFVAPVNNTCAFLAAMVDKIEGENQGNFGLALIEKGQISGLHFESTEGTIDQKTLFQAASISKWVSAIGIMALVEEGRIDLDTPISNYLTRWTLPKNKYHNSGVTVRRLLSHTAGLIDTPYEFAVDHKYTSAIDVLNSEAERVQIKYKPGSRWRYSNTGYTLLQMVVEDVTGESFEQYMQRVVLQPLGMSASTFILDQKNVSNLALFFDKDGNIADHFLPSSLAASSLYTNLSDLIILIQAHLPGPKGEAVGRDVLNLETLQLMRQPQPLASIEEESFSWGLGVILSASDGEGNFIIGHDGAYSPSPAIFTIARLNPLSGDGIVILSSGSESETLTGSIVREWVFWQTGKLDVDIFHLYPVWRINLIGFGAILFVLAGFIFCWQMNTRGQS